MKCHILIVFLFSILTLIIFQCSFSQVLKKTVSNQIENKLYLISSIRDIGSPDSNIVRITYDSNNIIQKLTEYVRVGHSSYPIAEVIYIKNSQGYLTHIMYKDWTFHKSDRMSFLKDFVGNHILDLPLNRDKMYNLFKIKYDYRGLIGFVGNDTSGSYNIQYTDDSLIMRIYYTKEKTKKIEHYWEYDYDGLSRIAKAQQFILNGDGTVKKNEIYKMIDKRYNRFTQPFQIGNFDLVLFSPFSKIKLNYFLETLKIDFNSQGLPEKMQSKDGNIKYRLEYTTGVFKKQDDVAKKKHDTNIKYPQFDLALKSFQKDQNNLLVAQQNQVEEEQKKKKMLEEMHLLDSANRWFRNQNSQTLKNNTNLKNPIGIYPVWQSDREIQESRYYKTSRGGQLIQIYSHKKDYFVIENYFSLPFVVQVSGYNDVYLLPRFGASYLKINVSDSSTIRIVYPDSIYRMNKLYFEENYKQMSNSATNTSVLELASLSDSLNKEKEATLRSKLTYYAQHPTEDEYQFRFEDPVTGLETSRTQRHSDDLRSEIDNNNMRVGVAGVFAGAFFNLNRDEKEREKKKMLENIQNNEEFHNAFNGVKNKFSSLFQYYPLKYYINLGFNRVKNE